MAKASTKVAVSIPPDLFQAVERARRLRGSSRSAFLQDALRHWLKHQAEVTLVREYEAGYRSKPETRREIKAAESTAMRLLSETEW